MIVCGVRLVGPSCETPDYPGSNRSHR